MRLPLTINPWRCLNLPAHAQEGSGRVLDCRMADDAASIASTILRMGLIDFRNMSDDELESYINRNASNYDIHGAIFEHDRRKRLRDTETGGSRQTNPVLDHRWSNRRYYCCNRRSRCCNHGSVNAIAVVCLTLPIDFDALQLTALCDSMPP